MPGALLSTPCLPAVLYATLSPSIAPLLGVLLQGGQPISDPGKAGTSDYIPAAQKSTGGDGLTHKSPENSQDQTGKGKLQESRQKVQAKVTRKQETCQPLWLPGAVSDPTYN